MKKCKNCINNQGQELSPDCCGGVNAIDACQLRIGNMVRFVDTKETCPIYQIEHRFRKTYRVNDLNDNDQIEPIPLTEEWILKMGFYINENGEPEKETVDGMDIALSISMNESPYKYSPWFVNKENLTYYIMGVDVKYVHSLQNLYFALTGQELTIK